MDSSSTARKRVLIITYYWPPSGGIGVLRCLKIAKYLRDFGWEPIIYTALDAHYPNYDPSNIKDIPEGVEVHKGKIWEPHSWYKKLTGKAKDENVNNVLYVNEGKSSLLDRFSIWIRSNFFIPDARAFWIKPSVKYLTEYINNNRVDAILTDGPPHSNTRIATLLKKKTGIPWLADFQDPWTQVDYFNNLSLTSWGLKKHQRLEQEAFKHADRMTIVSDSWKKDLEEIGAKNVSVIPWGFDPDDFKNLKVEVEKKFIISHLGILGPDRCPKVLFETVRDMMNVHPDLANDLELQMFGQVDHSVVEEIKNIGIEKVFKIKGFVPRQEALLKTCSSSVLLLLLNQQDNVMGRIPGKFFEYLAAQRPILTLGPPSSDVANIVDKTERGYTINYNDKTKMRATLEELYRKYKDGSLKQPMTKSIAEYSSINLTGKFAKLLNEIT